MENRTNTSPEIIDNPKSNFSPLFPSSQHQQKQVSGATEDTLNHSEVTSFQEEFARRNPGIGSPINEVRISLFDRKLLVSGETIIKADDVYLLYVGLSESVDEEITQERVLKFKDIHNSGMDYAWNGALGKHSIWKERSSRNGDGNYNKLSQFNSIELYRKTYSEMLTPSPRKKESKQNGISSFFSILRRIARI